MNKIQSELRKMIDVNAPIIYINNYDYVRTDELIVETVGSKNIVEWNPATGTTNFANKTSLASGADESLEDFLLSKYTFETGGIVTPNYIVLKDIQDYIVETKIKTLLQLIAQRKLYDRRFDTTIIIESPVTIVPPEISQYVSFLEIDFPTEEEINELIDWHIEVNQYDKTKFTQSDREKLLPSLKGMTPFEIDRMLDVAMSSNGSLSAEDKEMILKQKKVMVKNSGVLELVDTPESLNSIGGIQKLKDYIKRKALIFQEIAEAQKFGVAIPKGVFLVGMPGCGKSLCAKATAATFEAPLLKLDMGSMMDKYQGGSEENLRKAIKIAEAAAPCVLWIDEIEKAFAGVGSGNASSESLMRMFGYFLSWMQDKTSCVYVFATANNAEVLPAELKRKGRFDEIFCVKLPNPSERESIFKVHIEKKKKHGCPVADIDYARLAKETEGYNGADIESIVNETIEDCYLNNKQKVSTDYLLATAKRTKSITITCAKQIETMNKLFSDNSFTDASTEEKETS